MDVRGLIVKSVGIPIAERWRGWPIRKYMRELDATQWWSPEQIADLQKQKLSRLIRHAYETVPFYRKAMTDLALTPEDIGDISDLCKLPILTKDVFKANFPECMLSDAYADRKLVTMTSSGSTGEPFKYLISEDEKARKWAALFRIWSWTGWELGDKYAILAAFPLRAFKNNRFGAWVEDRFSGLLTLSAFDIYADGRVDEYVRRLMAFKPKLLRGYASSLHYLAQTIKNQGLELRLPAVASTGETLFDFQRELIESVFGCKVYDGYGVEGMETAGQCEAGSYHIHAEGIIAEVVDEKGNPCPPGVQGQLILTDLNRMSMPFIRYNTQDVATLSDKKCSCGRGLPIIERVYGRLTDVGVTPSGKGILVHHFTALFMKQAHIGAVEAFQVVQERPDYFILNVVPGPRYEALRGGILAEMQQIVGDGTQVEECILDRIPTTPGGKRRLFVSKCGLQAAGLALSRTEDADK